MNGLKGPWTLLPAAAREPAAPEMLADDGRPDPTCVVVEVVTMAGRARQVEFRVHLDEIEVWSWDRCRGIFDRERLRAWLASPVRWISAGEVILQVDPRSAGERIALNLPDVVAWTLSPRDQAALVERV